MGSAIRIALALDDAARHIGGHVATFAIGEAGAANAALYAAQILSVTDAGLAQKLADFRAAQNAKARAMELPL